MEDFILSPVLLGIPFGGVVFKASGEPDAFGYGRGHVDARCVLRQKLELGSHWRIDRHVVNKMGQVMNDATFVAECEVVERNGEIGAIWRMLAPPRKPGDH